MVPTVARKLIARNMEVVVAYYEVLYRYFLTRFEKTTKNIRLVIRPENRAFSQEAELPTCL
jgi:hypothetical protein